MQRVKQGGLPRPRRLAQDPGPRHAGERPSPAAPQTKAVLVTERRLRVGSSQPQGVCRAQAESLSYLAKGEARATTSQDSGSSGLESPRLGIRRPYDHLRFWSRSREAGVQGERGPKSCLKEGHTQSRMHSAQLHAWWDFYSSDHQPPRSHTALVGLFI